MISIALPPGSAIENDAEALVELCAMEFVQFITMDVCEKLRGESRKTMHGSDILNSLSKFGLDDLVAVLDHWLKVFKRLVRKGGRGFSKGISV